MAQSFALGDDRLTSLKLHKLSTHQIEYHVSDEAWSRLDGFRSKVMDKVKSGETIYGINTGFGLLSNVKIKPDDLTTLQQNIIRSHACGVGKPLGNQEVTALLFLRNHTSLIGYSGISRAPIEQTLKFLELGILPFVPEQGSVGASGDLAPLAHVALNLLGEGEVFYKHRPRPTKEVFKELGLSPIDLGEKEGLCLINGTHFTAAIGALVLEKSRNLIMASELALALSLDALKGSLVAFDPRIQDVRGQEGQKIVAKNIRSLFEGEDTIMENHTDCGRVQDPYSFRCSPQVQGASRDTFLHAERIINNELNSSTDNPLVFDNGDILSGGNFHGEPIAMVLDFMAIAVAELASISEQRLSKLCNPAMNGGHPAFLVENPGLNSGFMIPHTVAAALVSENKGLAHPASVDSIPTNADKEDHVSMGPWAARKLRSITENTARVIAIELIAAAQGVDMYKPLTPSPKLSLLMEEIRTRSAFMSEDRAIYREIEAVTKWILSDDFRAFCTKMDIQP